MNLIQMAAEVRKDEFDSPAVISWLVFTVAAICFHGIFSVFYPNQEGMLGHDYSFFVPNLYDGLLWFNNNSFFDVPWFTPSFCGGQPFFADPQSIYYSLTQWLALIFTPVTALYLSLLFYACLAYWGMYLLCRSVFLLSVSAACFAAVVFMFNGFLTHRLIVGHITFLGIVLIPWIALFLVTVRDFPIGRLRMGGKSLFAGLLVAYWVQSGMVSLILPASLSVLLVVAIAGVRNQLNLRTFLLRAVLAGLVAVSLSAAKLSASVAFLSHFPRDNYRLPGVDGLTTSIEMIMRSLSFSSQSTYERSLEVMLNQQWLLAPHEWSYGLTPVPIILVGVGLAIFISRLSVIKIKSPVVVASLLLAIAVLVLPVVLNIYTPEWNAILKRTPLIANSSSMVRWYLIYIPVVALLAAISIDCFPISRKNRQVLVGVCLTLVIGFNAFEDRRFYFTDGANYDAAAATKAWQEIGTSGQKLNAVGVNIPGADLVRNDVIFAGMSQLACYNPVFGYRLESLPRKSLREGAPTLLEDGVYNLKNPACYLFPEENQCAPGDHFKEGQAESIESFVSYRSFEFDISSRQKFANILSTFSWLASAVLLLLMLATAAAPVFRSSESKSG